MAIDIDLDSHRYASLYLADLGIDLPAWNDSATVADLLAHQMVPEPISGFRCSATHRDEDAVRYIFPHYGDDVFEYARKAGVQTKMNDFRDTYTAWCARLLNECHRHLACQLEPRIRGAIAAMASD